MEPRIVESSSRTSRGAHRYPSPGGCLRWTPSYLIVKRGDRPASAGARSAHYCVEPGLRTLEPGDSLYEPLFIAAGTNGWLINGPGPASSRSALHLNDEDVVSNPLYIRVAPPQSYDE